MINSDRKWENVNKIKTVREREIDRERERERERDREERERGRGRMIERVEEIEW